MCYILIFIGKGNYHHLTRQEMGHRQGGVGLPST